MSQQAQRTWISLWRSVASAVAACRWSVLDSLLMNSGMSCTTRGNVSAVATRTTSLMASNAAVCNRVPSLGFSDCSVAQLRAQETRSTLSLHNILYMRAGNVSKPRVWQLHGTRGQGLGRTASRSDWMMSLKYGDRGDVPSRDVTNPAASWLYA